MLDIGAEAERRTFDNSLQISELPPLLSGWRTSSSDRMLSLWCVILPSTWFRNRSCPLRSACTQEVPPNDQD